MSVNLMSAIFQAEFFDLKDENGNVTKASTAKLVLLAMADHANDDGEGIYPSVETLCRKTALSPQTIRNTFDALRHNGIIFLNGRSKYGTNNHAINTACFPRAIGKEVVYLTLQPLEGLTGNSDPSNQSFLPPHRLDPNHTLTIPEPSTDTSFPEPTPTKKKGDIFDGMAFYEKQAKERGVDKVEDLLVRLGKGIGVNIPRSVANQSVAKRLLKEESEGRTLDQFLTWLRSDEWRMAHLYIYADPEKVWTIWPQAFIAPEKEDRPEYRKFQFEDDE